MPQGDAGGPFVVSEGRPGRTLMPTAWEPGHVAVVLTAAIGAVVSARPIKDPDLFWHLLIGEQILDTSSLKELGATWTTTAPSESWQTSQWAAEVTMSWLYELGGYTGLVVARSLVAWAVFLAIGLLLLRRSTPWAAAIVMPLATLLLIPALQDRPQVASMVLLVWLSWRVSSLISGHPPPSVWEVAAICFVWAQFHGLWVLAPFAFGLCALGAILSTRDGHGRSHVARYAWLAGVALVAGLVNPLGWRSLTLPLRVGEAAGLLQEWQRTSLEYPGTITFLILVSLIIVIWARSRDSVGTVEIAHVLGWTAFAFLAFRNVAPAAIMLAPIAASRLALVLPPSATASPREQRILRTVTVVILLVATIAVTARAALIDPLSKARALAIAQTLASSPEPKRVLNDYNTSGVLLRFGGGKLTLGIDGRADRLGGTYLKDYQEAQDLRGDWRSVVASVDPDVAVLKQDLALTEWLIGTEGWRIEQQDGDYVLLVPPSDDA